LGSGNFGKAVDTAMLVRQKLDLPAPPTDQPLAVQNEFARTMELVANRSAEEIADLPELKEERIIMGQRMLETLLESTYTAKPSMYPLIVFLLVGSSVEYGINASSCDAFAAFGLLLCVAFGEIKRGIEMSKAAELLLINKPDRRRMKSRVTFHVEGFVYWWTRPIHESLQPLLQGYQVGIETGDIGSACYNLLFRTPLLWYAARPLEGLQAELETVINAFDSLNQVGQKWMVLVYLLAVKQLRGADVQNTGLNFESILEIASETGNQMLRAYVFTVRLELLVLHQDWESAAKLLDEAGDLRPSLPDVSHTRFVFIQALVCLKKAQASLSWMEKMKRLPLRKKDTWKIRGLELVEVIHRWVEIGNVNMVHCLHILTAERSVLEGNKKTAVDDFNSAIKVAARAGFLQDKGLAHALASNFAAVHGDSYWAKHHKGSSQECYTEWGAKALTL